MFKGESDRIGEAISTVVFLSLCIILIFSAISIFISLILDISKQLLIKEILTRINLSIAFFGYGFFPLRIWQKRNEVNEEKEYWQVLKQSFNDSIDTETLK
ncbi:MAG: hypothetical protein P8X91_02675, partial [Candidatus Bathyarchaeota archaeon]